MTDRTDRIQDRTIRTESWIRTLGKGQPGPESQKRTERTEQPEQDNQKRMTGTGISPSVPLSIPPGKAKFYCNFKGQGLQRRLMDSDEITRTAKDYRRVIAGKV
jgi:hypothetical protein